MNFEKVSSDGMRHEYRVVLSADEIENQIVEAVKERAKTFKMQGFRAGHVPFDMVRSNVESSVIGKVFDNLISKACDEIIKDSQARDLSSRPTYKFETPYEKGKDITLTMTIEIAPSFELGSYEIEIEKIVPSVSDEEVSEAMAGFMKNFPNYEKADKDYAIKPQDEVLYKATCYNNGVESKKKSFSNKVLIPNAIPEGAEFLANFIGKKIGETFDFVPATDKNLNYKVMVRAINKAVTDMAPEDYAKSHGFKDLGEMTQAFRSRLESEITAQAFLYHKNQILEALEKQYKFDLPKGILEQEMNAVLASVKKEQESEAQKAKEKGEKFELKSDEDLKKEYEDVVTKRVLLGYVLNKIARQENIKVSDQELQQLILMDIKRNPSVSPNTIVKYYRNNPEALAYKRAEIVEHKVIDFLISKAKAKEVSKTKKEVEEIVNKLLED